MIGALAGIGTAGPMKGVIFNLLESVVARHHGPDAWDDLLDAAGLEGAYTSMGSYPDLDVERLVVAASQALGLTREEILRWFGREAMKDLAEAYGLFFEPHRTTRSFLSTLNAIIHPEVRKLYAGAACPHFLFGEADDALVMEYRSTRALCALAEGFVEGASAHFGEAVQLAHPRCVQRGDDACVFHVRWPADVAGKAA